MFERPLPATFKPVKIARQGGRLQGVMALQALSVLAADCASDEGLVQADLHMQMVGPRPELLGSAKASVSLVCQRCLEPVAVELEVDVALGFVRNEEEAKTVPSHLEPYFFSEEELSLASVLEQELILALPIVAYHANCSMALPETNDESQVATDVNKNPFAVLEQLKDSKNKPDH